MNTYAPWVYAERTCVDKPLLLVHELMNILYWYIIIVIIYYCLCYYIHCVINGFGLFYYSQLNNQLTLNTEIQQIYFIVLKLARNRMLLWKIYLN